MSFPDYHAATNKAYRLLKQLLVRHGHFNIRTDVLFILDQLPDVVILSYTDACEKYDCDRSLFTSISNHGFTIKKHSAEGTSRHIVLFNDWKDDTTIRFTLAHEIGHIVLNHTEDNEVANKEANCFARNLLCPIPVQRMLDLREPLELCDVFDVGERMADISLQYVWKDLNNIESALYSDLYDIFEMIVWNPVTWMEFMTLFEQTDTYPSFSYNYANQRLHINA